MSHFSVIVTGRNVENQLQPFHEFECTGTDDQYVQNIDETEEYRKDYLSQTTTRLKSPDGSLHDPYADHFYRVPTAEESGKIGSTAGTGCGHGMSWTSRDWGDGNGYSTKVRFVPEGWEEVDVPVKDVKAFAEWLSDYHSLPISVYFDTDPNVSDKEYKYGYVLLHSTGEVKQVVRRTNPNRKWDRWQIGGRYSNRLILTDGSNANSAVKSSINYPMMEAAKITEAAKIWNVAQEVFGNLPVHKSWEEMGRNRDAYWSQPRLQAWREKSKANNDLFWMSADDFLVSRDQYIKQAADSAYGAFAFLHEGQWTEKGSVGWFGCASNEKTDGDWYSWLRSQIEFLPSETLITVVDCHI